MLYEDIKDDAKLVFGDCDGPLLRRRVKEAIDVLANSGDGTWDGLIGEMTICSDSICGTVTLPRDVLKPLSINIDGCPTIPRDKWFEYHLNGTGSNFSSWRGAWDDRGTFPVCREPAQPTTLKLSITAPQDTNKEITIRYLDTDDRERVHTFIADILNPPVTSFQVKRITAVSKPLTVGDVRLFYMEPIETLAGWYYPDETAPEYRRIRINASNSVQIIYRRRTIDITSDKSYIPLRSKMALMQALWSIKKRYQGDIQAAQAAQADAIMLLEQDQYVRAITNSPIGPQVLDYSSDVNERLQYGRLGGISGRRW